MGRFSSRTKFFSRFRSSKSASTNTTTSAKTPVPPTSSSPTTTPAGNRNLGSAFSSTETLVEPPSAPSINTTSETRETSSTQYMGFRGTLAGAPGVVFFFF
ncbi:hypothetical protein P280DRAFT_533907 [Massarina eburnea CBS 473.64]|uniref:Uncharacterized protein n=1 Tax=Massarina eburnea CBS 473.64 TaxID=1395130 RepID=A0A6A6RMB9_9PLEO|nr:hypothetical protein P280DRAFT_533907 [Massarina eburnea CBS 473.64]